jgi:type II secretory pathway pseudopilin PulG
MRRTRGYTIVELQVEIGIIAVLISLLLQALQRVKQQAKDINCASNLRQLTMGCLMYQNAFKRWPQGMHNSIIGETIVPTDVQSRLLNQIGPFIGAKEIPNTPDWPGTPVPAPKESDLPAVALSMEYRDNPDMFRGPAIGNGQTYWYTGYSYFGMIDETPNTLGQVLKQDRVANKSKRGVLWADSMVYWIAPPAFFYANHAAAACFRQADRPIGLRGQHVGWSDGSVIWTRLTDRDVNVANCDQTASYRVAPSSGYYWWN